MSMAYQEHPAYKHFEAISRIPHGSGQEKALSDYILFFAKNLKLQAVQDEIGNLVIRKPAAKGYENAPVVMLQGHLDMVCEKNMDVAHDFTREPLKLITEGDWLRAEGTTLGADDGVAVAYCMALMENDDIPHPALELVLTVQEETGLEGATALDPGLVNGDMLINLDSGEEGVFLTSCAGGLKLDMDVPVAREAAPAGSVFARVRVTGLMGGHSGVDIDKGRGNSIRLMAALLERLRTEYGARIASLLGGLKDNAIPREAEAVVCVPAEKLADALAAVEAYDAEVRPAYDEADPQLKILAAETDAADGVLTDDSARALLAFLLGLPNGPLAYSAAFPELVETSNNVGVVRLGVDAAQVVCALRSSVAASKHALAADIRAVAEKVNAAVLEHGEYPAWEYNPDSRLRELAVETLEALSGQKAILAAVHAGLECGLFAAKRPGLDMIAFGPTMRDIHSPLERLYLPSFIRTWELLVEILRKITA